MKKLLALCVAVAGGYHVVQMSHDPSVKTLLLATLCVWGTVTLLKED